MPGRKDSAPRMAYVTIMPIKIENTGPPTTGTSRPRYQDGMAITKHKRIPFQYFINKFILSRIIQLSRFGVIGLFLLSFPSRLYRQIVSGDIIFLHCGFVSILIQL